VLERHRRSAHLVDFTPSKPIWLEFFPSLEITCPDITAPADVEGLGEPQIKICHPALNGSDVNAVPGGEIAHRDSVVIADHRAPSCLQQYLL
jgi:hypothetical protein